MRWKIGSRDRAPRQIDRHTRIADRNPRRFQILQRRFPQAEHHRLYRAKPNRSVVSFLRPIRIWVFSPRTRYSSSVDRPLP
jgi:hypothetical protein